MRRSFLLVGLVAAFATRAAFRAEPQRRAAHPPAQTGSDPLGLWEPESVRSILLLYSGKNLSKAKADELETDLRKTPDKIESRLLLIGYYNANARTPADRSHLREQVLWMVQNHPEHPATAEPSLRELPDDVDGNAQILAMWTKNIASDPDDLAIMKNAEKFFFGKDPDEADRLIHRISTEEPNNREWPTELAKLYRMFGIPGQHIDDPAERAVESYKRVLELTRTPSARVSLAGDMAQDAFKEGDFPAAAALAKIHLESPDRAAMQRANTILGRVALRSGDLAGADHYLLDSAGPAAATDIAVSGPTLVLARELLNEGQRDAVIAYLERCMALWPRGREALQLWIEDIKRGGKPNFGNFGF